MLLKRLGIETEYGSSRLILYRSASKEYQNTPNRGKIIPQGNSFNPKGLLSNSKGHPVKTYLAKNNEENQ
jgi:hypothetical protein